jgi:diguanylate cyclase (GGDEF)-like protein/PAS domain S-box-containing protein
VNVLDEECPALFQATMEAAQVGIFVLDDGRFIYVNPFFCQMFGYSAEELLTRRLPIDLVMPEQRERLAQQMTQRQAGIPGARYELTGLRCDGSCFPLSVLGMPACFNGRPVSVGTLLDISEQKEAERRIRELADFDTLTGLPNRRLLQDRIEQLLAAAEQESSSAALLFVDIDHFKRINDSLGHRAGDELLCALAARYTQVVRRVDTLARLGGDEFVILLPDVGSLEAAELARRLHEMSAMPFSVAGHALTVTSSIGISLYPQDGRDIDSLLKNADAAMYRAKDVGRNAFQFYSAEMNTATLERLMMESSLRHALEAKEFELHYQPLVSLKAGKIIGAEALIRWRHPDLGIIMPDRFIPVAEDSGMINLIGDWVLFAACRQAQAWLAQGLPLQTIAVNVAPVQFRQPGFVEMVAGALSVSGLPAECLELELTERTVMHDVDVTLGTLTALHRMGVALSLDDFGTGYSSLAYLKRFPVGKLKIDRSFIRDLETDPDDRAIASTIVSMGRSLRLSVLAEGVETAEQLSILRDMGCEMVQGYYFSKPVSAERMSELLYQQPYWYEK